MLSFETSMQSRIRLASIFFILFCLLASQVKAKFQLFQNYNLFIFLVS